MVLTHKTADVDNKSTYYCTPYLPLTIPVVRYKNKYSAIPELGTRQHCRDVTMFSGPKIFDSGIFLILAAATVPT